MKRTALFQAMCAVATLAAVIAAAISPAWAVDPLAGNVVYYYNYADEPGTSGTSINDQSPNNWDQGNFFAQDFVFSNDPLPATLPGRIFDVDATTHGGLTEANPLGHAAMVANGGYTFETYVKRTSQSTGTENIWNPEGMHSIEIADFQPTEGRELQFAMRGLGAFWLPVDEVLPIGEWHHVMAVMETLPPAPADPSLDPLSATYKLFIDGTQVGVTIGPFDLNGSFSSLDFSPNTRHGIGHNEGGTPGFNLHGQLAFTRLSLGALDVSESLYAAVVPEPATAALLGFGALALGLLHRRD